MKAVIMDSPRAMHVGEWETPRPGPDDVLVAPAAIGICAGDMYYYLGKNPYAVYPQITGHEIAGTVVETGVNVEGLSEGTPVVVEPFLGCGHCYPCRHGKSNCCVNLTIIGVHIPGGYAEYVTAPASHVHRIPQGLTLVEASFAEPVAIGVQACRRGEVVEGDKVLVMGCGPIGLSLIEVAQAKGADVTACDVNPKRLEAAAAFGAHTIVSDDQLEKRILEETDGEGMPVVMEATGVPSVFTSSVDFVAAGGRLVILSLFKKGEMVEMPGLDITRKELTLVGSRASVDCFPEALDLMSSGRIEYPKIATEFNLWDAPDVFARLAADPGLVHKGVFINNP